MGGRRWCAYDVGAVAFTLTESFSSVESGDEVSWRGFVTSGAIDIPFWVGSVVKIAK